MTVITVGPQVEIESLQVAPEVVASIAVNDEDEEPLTCPEIFPSSNKEG